MANTEILLLEKIENLGFEGDIVTVWQALLAISFAQKKSSSA